MCNKGNIVLWIYYGLWITFACVKIVQMMENWKKGLKGKCHHCYKKGKKEGIEESDGKGWMEDKGTTS